MTGTIFDIKEMAVHDGPGIRTTVFFKGCPLRCIWCHNPEGLITAPQIMYKESRCRKCGACSIVCRHEECRPFGRCIKSCTENALEISGREISAEDLCSELKATAEVLGDELGGFTFSGGEPLFQSEFLLEVLEKLSGYHLCVETSGYTESENFEKVLAKLSFVIMDIKLADDAEHRKYTGVGNKQILKNLEILKRSGKPYVIRTPLIPNIVDNERNLSGIKQIIGDAEWEKLPYNPMAAAKYNMLGMNYNFKETGQ